MFVPQATNKFLVVYRTRVGIPGMILAHSEHNHGSKASAQLIKLVTGIHVLTDPARYIAELTSATS